MEQSIGLRMYVAARLTAGFVVASLGSVVLGFSANSAGSDLLVGVLFWLLTIFVGIVVALEGVIVLLERTTGRADGAETVGRRGETS